MNNVWNRLIYKGWAPIYERFFNTGTFLTARKEVFQNLSLEKGSQVLFIGVGTGADIPYFLTNDYKITAIDYSDDMLQVAKDKFSDSPITFIEMDAQQLTFSDETFDFIVASLIISVVPDPNKTMTELVRVLKINGSFLIFDKFKPKNEKVKFTQKFLRPIIKICGTDIGLDFYQVFKVVKRKCEIMQDESIMMNGMYRKIIGVKQKRSD